MLHNYGKIQRIEVRKEWEGKKERKKEKETNKQTKESLEKQVK